MSYGRIRNRNQSVRWWAEDEKGNPSEKGIVKIEYPDNFFGDK